jgi:hypothetical protein
MAISTMQSARDMPVGWAEQATLAGRRERPSGSEDGLGKRKPARRQAPLSSMVSFAPPGTKTAKVRRSLLVDAAGCDQRNLGNDV